MRNRWWKSWHWRLSHLHSLYAREVVIWPTTLTLFQWIHLTWTNNSLITLCSKWFFIVYFYDHIDYHNMCLKMFPKWGTFIAPSFLDFVPNIVSITKTLVLVCLPNFPLHFLYLLVFYHLGNNFGTHIRSYLKIDVAISHIYVCMCWDRAQ